MRMITTVAMAETRRVSRRSASAARTRCLGRMFTARLWASRKSERPPFGGLSTSMRRASRLVLGLGEIGLCRLGDLLEAFAALFLIVVQVLEGELLRWQHRDRLLLFSPEQPSERAGLRHPIELVATRRETGARGDELADDDVLLEAQEPVLLAHDRGLGEDACRLLEGGGREEARGRERRLGHAEQDRLRRRGLAARGDRPRVDVLELEAIEELHREKLGVAGLLDADLAEHRADDDVDVLVVDRHT